MFLILQDYQQNITCGYIWKVMVSYMTVVFFDDFPVNHTGIQVQLPCSLLFPEAQEIPTTWSRPYFNNHPQISNYVVASCGRLPCSLHVILYLVKIRTDEQIKNSRNHQTHQLIFCLLLALVRLSLQRPNGRPKWCRHLYPSNFAPSFSPCRPAPRRGGAEPCCLQRFDERLR